MIPSLSAHLLAQVRVRHAEHGDLRNARVPRQDVFQLQAADAVPAAADHVHAGAAQDAPGRRVATDCRCVACGAVAATFNKTEHTYASSAGCVTKVSRRRLPPCRLRSCNVGRLECWKARMARIRFWGPKWSRPGGTDNCRRVAHGGQVFWQQQRRNTNTYEYMMQGRLLLAGAHSPRGLLLRLNGEQQADHCHIDICAALSVSVTRGTELRRRQRCEAHTLTYVCSSVESGSAVPQAAHPCRTSRLS